MQRAQQPAIEILVFLSEENIVCQDFKNPTFVKIFKSHKTKATHMASP